MRSLRPNPVIGRRAAAATLLALATMGSAAKAEVLDITWDAAGRFERVATIASGKFVEVCGKLPAGLNIGWEFGASAPLDFNVHYHVGKEVVFPSKRTAVVSAKGALVTQIDQDYCWMWSNPSSASTSATVTVKLQR